jgi:hypothetical protein
MYQAMEAHRGYETLRVPQYLSIDSQMAAVRLSAPLSPRKGFLVFKCGWKDEEFHLIGS